MQVALWPLTDWQPESGAKYIVTIALVCCQLKLEGLLAGWMRLKILFLVGISYRAHDTTWIAYSNYVIRDIPGYYGARANNDITANGDARQH